MFSTGLLMSAMFARLIPHLNVGAQKNTGKELQQNEWDPRTHAAL